jgi:hypothetical protein
VGAFGTGLEDETPAKHPDERVCGTFVPLAFAPGEAFLFDCSEDWAVLVNARV